ncbi:bifunctional [glutamate--ammonia ligase]-adenylyl-L-tyrosine phosphorylase/[glutamate--ammonia-ligase] adenylyltransferase [Candidatus Deferrimicrobium sp.]|uniref:bifunctional [glutamate--ammonia ligase]-adenylyl-L-tyrosine phosphorylase/[glutamate--ammonia-ligase] adenylyltransferase n=1 Tax=Candidatus Deferrimicrobium sp. TaxID=3060586 RepID=UPI00271D6DC8|nr:bifunctional [glutamate--ammonia ligase]-adenylyl-L-tyrosine phosphorylase/[glutamate--ammonia-ligase] adenylyltransferase [Candidatus Deferrimicrobium sp.]MDO8737368.1 bifunctional [glutamate--ammonia ligase]-adenylyl-L-tyrosine phosphorylase/[glutamate--ammonia-ligase] adenylyltransferase [Candidatus Deferrimicrobium sp.]
MNPIPRAGKSAPTADRLREIGVRDTARALSLLSDLLQHLPREHAGWESIYRAAAVAPDPDLFFLNLSRWFDSLPGAILTRAFARDDLLPLIGALLGGSEFIPEQIARRPEIFEFLFLEDGVLRRPGPEALGREALAAADRCVTEEELKADLRRMKHREVARIAARDLSGVAPLPEVTEDLSRLASAALEGAIRFSRRALDARLGAPVAFLPDGTRRLGRFVVMGMGKLGALELNFSSDIDIVYLYETDQGETEGAARSVSLHEYFIRLGEAVTRIVSEATEDGFVFRVDLRLRPEGTRGELANSLRSAEIYYESWGQTWERAALIKACPVAGDLSLGEEFLRSVVPFVYRKYLDFTAIEEIKGMKDRINLATARSLRSDRDVKLGLGGIREIEFFAQAHQLIYGGKEPKLRRRGTVETISDLSRMGIVTEEEREGLAAAYDFLRRLEHRIQAHRERQTHVLPQREEDLSRLARAMGLADPPALLSALDRHAAVVHGIYSRLFGGARREESPGIPAEIEALFLHGRAEEDAPALLARLGFRDVEAAQRSLDVLRHGPPHVRIPQRARHYLDKIGPEILHRVAMSPDPDLALTHVERFLSAIGARTMFYALLYEKPKVIEALVRLFGSSRFLSGFLLRHPELLDTFLGTDLSALVKSKSDLRTGLADALTGCDDFEQELDELRRFKNLETLRIGIHDMTGSLSLEEGMFQLSALAEVLLSQALLLAIREVRRRFGVAMEAATGAEAFFCVLGMGKLGSEELSYHSDLDIIFLYSGPGESGKLSNHEYFAKVAQRMISILTTSTREGLVYRLDTRLRPSGNAGPLVSSLEAFERYHAESAHLWERQALLKCRFVAGDRDFGKRVEEKIRGFIYERPLPPNAAEEIHRLRMRMEQELGRERGDRLNLKVGRGGVVDVEFAAQYLQLLHGGSHPAVRARGTLKALYELQRAGIVTLEQYKVLDEGYRFLRSLDVRLRLAHDASIDSFDPQWLEPERLERYRKETDRIRKVYLELLGLPGSV